MSTSKTLRFALLANLSLVAAGCGVFGSGDDTKAANDGNGAAADPANAPPGMKAVPVGGPADPSELTEQFGLFVTPSGAASGDGTRARPLASIQAAIDLGTRVGKRVYVCTGSYAEALVLADSISVIGGLDCSDPGQWRTSTNDFSRIASPTSPAIRGKNIATSTRLEGLDIVAPDGIAPSGSSIGVLADAATLVISRSKITAGSGANGVDGVEGVTLTPSITPAEYDLSDGQCGDATLEGANCTSNGTQWFGPANRLGGTNACDGQPANPGGAGGSGGIYQWKVLPQYDWVATNGAATAGQVANQGAAGANGTNGASANAIGAFTADGYAAANGTAGADGAPGGGGAGGDGYSPAESLPRGPTDTHAYSWRGFSGAGGGAGGCAGLAGTAGTGGGASIAVLSLGSTIGVDGAALVAARGGNGGRGTFGSDPSSGGAGGINRVAPYAPKAAGQAGGRGGSSGVSGNGASGPSLGVAYQGTAPVVGIGSTIRPSDGGDAIDARSMTDAFGTAKTIPATTAGVSKDIFAF